MAVIGCWYRNSLAVLAILFAIASSIFWPVQAHSPSPSPSPSSPAASPTSDATSIDQGIAYALMLVALGLTYLIHTLDASSS